METVLFVMMAIGIVALVYVLIANSAADTTEPTVDVAPVAKKKTTKKKTTTKKK